MKLRSGLRALLAAAFLGLLCMPLARAQRTKFSPGWNLFSTQQDIELGRRATEDAERQLPSCNAPRVDAYLTALGQKLIANLPTGGVRYPFEFHCINDKQINAFALPGGYVFVDRGLIEVCDNEAQLAGVIAHELAHVALRHGTAEATKAEAAAVGVGLLDALLGGNGGGQLLAEFGKFSAGGVLLHYSRTAETEADVVGTQVLYDAGYDPRALAQFFEKIEKEGQDENPPEFFSDHPNPEHRVERVQQEIQKLGGQPAKVKRDSPQFAEIRREVRALPEARRETLAAGGAASPRAGPPPLPSANYTAYQATAYTVKYPDNWKRYGEKDSVTFAPEGGVIAGPDGNPALAYGVIIDVRRLVGDPKAANALTDNTEALIKALQKDNPKMKIARPPARVRVNGQAALSTYLSNESPAGGEETDWLITVIRPQGVVSFICAAPLKESDKYDLAFDAVLDSVRFPK
jgi:beta-barrel assembly-enhancing protease